MFKKKRADSSTFTGWLTCASNRPESHRGEVRRGEISLSDLGPVTPPHAAQLDESLKIQAGRGLTGKFNSFADDDMFLFGRLFAGEAVAAVIERFGETTYTASIRCAGQIRFSDPSTQKAERFVAAFVVEDIEPREPKATGPSLEELGRDLP